MTPWHLKTCVNSTADKLQSEHNHRMGIAWYTAAFHRAAKLPKLKDVIGEKKQVVKQRPLDDMMTQLRKYQALRDKVKKNG